jgi:hypothetical protein
VAETREGRHEAEQALHARLVACDRLATNDLYTHFAVPIFRGLAGKFPTTDRDLVEQAVSDTLLDYFRRPDRYDPAKSSLHSYLFMAARRDLQNLIAQQRRRDREILVADPVELDTLTRKQWEDGDIAEAIADDERATELWAEAMAVARTDEERIVQQLRLEGERSTAEYAAALGWTDLPVPEQQRRLFQIKDRLDQRWRRRGKQRG